MEDQLILHKRISGYVSQEDNLMPTQTVYECVKFAAGF
jgi:ABC-type multidrug transport system ATPase subunit